MIYTQDSSHCIDYADIEKQTTRILIDEWKRTHPSEVFVLSGPGSFTNMRVGILAIQSLIFFLDTPPQLFAIDKISLYTALVDQNILPRQGYIFTGQRKTLALWDFLKKTHEMLLYPQCLLEKKDNTGLFFDAFYKEGGSDHYPQTVRYGYDKGSPWICYREKKVLIGSFFSPTESVSSFYLS